MTRQPSLEPLQVAPRRLPGSLVPGLTLPMGGGWEEEHVSTSARAKGWGVVKRGAAPGPSGVTSGGAEQAGAGAPKGGLISFPRTAEVSAVSLSPL